MDFSNITLGLAFLAGLASFLSPCVFALVPAYIGYLGGRSAATARTSTEARWITFSHGVAFVLGFSVVFILLGIATSALGGFLYNIRDILTKIGGIVVIIFGIHMIGIIRIPFLEYDLRAQSMPDRQRGYLASFLMGIFFSAGWSPCVGPILGAILTIALNGGSISQGAILLVAYSAGLAIPFLIASIYIGMVTTILQRYGRIMRIVEIVMGFVLIGVGILLFSGRFQQLASLGSFFGIIDERAVGQGILIGLLILIVLGLIPAIIAARKGRNFWEWWVFGAVLFPIAMVAVFFLKPKEVPVVIEEVTQGPQDVG
jgi:cytochrome c-type biogenesis protein